MAAKKKIHFLIVEKSWSEGDTVFLDVFDGLTRENRRVGIDFSNRRKFGKLIDDFTAAINFDQVTHANRRKARMKATRNGSEA